MMELGLCDRAFEIPRGSGAIKTQVFRELAQHQFDFVFCPHRSVRTALLVRPLRSNSKIGFHHWWNFFAFDQRVKFATELPDALRQLSLFQVFDDFKSDHFKQFASPSHRSTTFDFLKQPLSQDISMTLPQFSKLRDPRSKRVLIAPGSVWPTKRWTVAGYIGAAKTLAAQGYEIVLIGSPEERELCARIAGAVTDSKNMAGDLSLLKLIQVMATSHVLLTNDSGAMHMASVAGLPTVAVFGPTTLAQGYRPWQSHAVVVQKDLDCRPCGKHGGKQCPLGHHHCMVQITSDEVVQATYGAGGSSTPGVML